MPMMSYTHKRVHSTDSDNRETKRNKIADTLSIRSTSPAGSLFSIAMDEDNNEVSSAGSLFSGEETGDMETVDCLENSRIVKAVPLRQSFTIIIPSFPSPERRKYQKLTPKLIGSTKQSTRKVRSSASKDATRRKAANPPRRKSNAKSQRRLDDPPAWNALPHCTSQSHPHPRLPLHFVEYLVQCSARTDATADSSCPLLEFFQLKWDSSLNSLYCHTHSRLLPGNYLWQHISRSHEERHSGITRSSLLEAFLGHLKGCYPIIIDQSTEDVKKNLPSALNRSILSNSGSIAQRYKCPVSSCSSWIAVNNYKGTQKAEYVKHLKNAHKLSNKEHEMAIQVQPQWTEMVQIAGGKSRKGKGGDVHWFLLPHYAPNYDGARPKSGPGVFESNPAASASELWPMQAGWCDELERISKCLGLPLAEVTINLQDLAQPPTLDLLRKYDDELNRSIEKGLLLSNKLNLLYLSEGVQWVGRKFGAFGFLFPDDRKRSYKIPADEHILYLYRRLWTSSEAFLIRTLKKVVKEPRYRCLLLCSPEVKAAGMELLRLFVSSNDLNPNEVLERKHNLYLGFLRDEHSDAKVGSIPELALLSRCLLGTNEWRNAHHVRTLVTGGIWCLRGTVANWCYRTFANSKDVLDWKGPSENAEYVSDVKYVNPLDVMDDLEDMEDEEDLEEQEDFDVEGWPSIKGIPASDVNDLLDRISSRLDIEDDIEACNVSTSQNISINEFFEASSRYLLVTKPPKLTIFYRLVTISSALYNDATYKPPFQTTFEGDNFVLSDGRNVPLSVPLSGLMISAHRAVRDLGNAVRALSPQGFQLETFPFSQFTDNFSNAPLHAQPLNKQLLEPFLTSFRKEILQRFYGKWGLKRVEVDRWLDQYDDCYIAAAAAISLTTGGFGNAGFKHQCYSGPHRSVFLLKTGILAFVNPLVSRRKINYQIDLMATPPEASRYLLVLFMILLQISIELRCFKGQHHPNVSTHLWVLHHKRPNGWLFDSNYANRRLRLITNEILGIPLDARVIFRMQTGLLDGFRSLAFRTARHEVLDFYDILNCSPTIRKDRVSNLLKNVPFLEGIEVNTHDHRIGDRALLSVMRTLLFGTDAPKEAFITPELFAEAAILIIKALCEWSDGSHVDLSQPESEMQLELEDLRRQILEKLKASWKSPQSYLTFSEHFQAIMWF